MADCKKCRFRSICKKRPKTEGATIAECDLFRNDIERTEPMTNADRIRAMSDEELACTMYAASGMDDETIGFCKNLPKCRDILNSGQLIPDEDCTACMLDWLRQPVKEESK